MILRVLLLCVQVRHLSAIYLRMKINALWIRFTAEQQMGIKQVGAAV